MNTEQAKKIIEQVFTLIGVTTESITYSADPKRGHIFSIVSVEFEKVSSENSDLAKDFVYILKRMFNRSAKPGEDVFKCTIDINNQQSKTDDKIKVRALSAAQEAKNLKMDVTMDPMSSYERMVVHSTLADDPDISTESVGEGRERRVKVKYLSV
jgi:predicted RNA-binding protein Jag